MVKLIAKRAQSYAGRRIAAGAVFEARPRDARVLCAIGRADRYVEPAAPVEPVEQESDLQPESQPDKPKRAYKRRDMQAEK